MSPKLRLRPFLVLTKTKLKPSFALGVWMLASTSCLAQQSTTAEANSHSQDSQNQDAVATASPARCHDDYGSSRRSYCSGAHASHTEQIRASWR